ncbi:MAG: hypothetical protein V3T84_13445, partial [Phycisphaerales bacterium]
ESADTLGNDVRDDPASTAPAWPDHRVARARSTARIHQQGLAFAGPCCYSSAAFDRGTTHEQRVNDQPATDEPGL